MSKRPSQKVEISLTNPLRSPKSPTVKQNILQLLILLFVDITIVTKIIMYKLAV